MLLGSLERLRAIRSPGPTSPPQPATHLLWFFDAMLLLFALPWLTTRVLGVAPSLYIGIELVVTAAFLTAYTLVSGPSLDLVFSRRALARSMGLAVPCAAVVVVLVVTGIDETARPAGMALVMSLLWRGLAQAVGASLLQVAFPALVAREVSRTAPLRVRPWMRVGLSLVLVWALAAAHHLGFAQYDDRSLAPVEVTTTLVALPMIGSVNPAGSIVTQVVLHTAVIIEGYETEAIVPPRRSVVRSYEPPGLFPGSDVDDGGASPS